jgi:hypothetical protein
MEQQPEHINPLIDADAKFISTLILNLSTAVVSIDCTVLSPGCGRAEWMPA